MGTVVSLRVREVSLTLVHFKYQICIVHPESFRTKKFQDALHLCVAPPLTMGE